MKINLKNCWNIDEWEIVLEKWKLNIKYAINWTWKSTIARAIKYFIEWNEEDKQILMPYKFISEEDKNPEISWINDFKKIKIFNEDYVKNYTFKKDEILENSFSIFIENETYKNWIKDIDKLVKKLRLTFQENKDLDKLINDTGNFLDFIKISAKWDINKTSTILKWLEWAKKLNNPSSEFLEYKNYLIDNSINSKYVAWQMQWKDYLRNNKKECPCCISKIEESKIEKIKKFSTEYQKSDIDNLNKILDVIDGLFEYFNTNTQETITLIKNNIWDITEIQKSFLIKLRVEIEQFNGQLKKIKILDFYNLKDIENIKDEVKKYLFNLGDTSLYSYITSELTKSKVEIINNTLNELIEKISELNWKITKQKNILKSSIEKYEVNINSFLKSAWYKYTINVIEEENSDKYRFVLKPLNLDIEIKNANWNLSFWEKNAFALVLFMFQSLSEKIDFIVLDDPISSFDQNKKFAILNMLFWNLGDNLRWKTILILTHDFEPVIDIIKNELPKSLSNNKNAYFLENNNWQLIEKEIKKEHIKTFNKICIENLDKDIHILNKCIFLRRKYEIDENKWLEYNLLSSLIHKRKNPTKKVYNTKTEEIDSIILTAGEISETSDYIKRYIPGFDYYNVYNDITDNNKIKEIYKNSSSNYEKFQIYRIIKDDWKWKVRIDDSVIKKFIDESFHIENDYLFQLNPINYELVPLYVIEECNKDLNL